MKDVFISYKTEEFDEANWVKTTLETNGISCWMAPMSIPGGSSYAVEIPQAIRECKVFVLILSEKSQLSKWVPKELDQAINEEKLILPFMLENCPLKDDFNFYLTNVQRYAAYESKTLAMDKMIREIKALLGKNDVPENTASEKKIAAEDEDDKKDDSEAKSKPEENVRPETEVVANPVTAEKPAVKKEAKKKKIGNKDNSATAKKVVFSVIAVLIAAIMAAVFTAPGKIMIADTEFSEDQEYISIREKSITAEDIDAFEKFETIYSLSFIDCTLPDADLTDLLSKIKSSITIDNCKLTDDTFKSIGFDQLTASLLDISNNPGITDLSVIAGMSESLSTLRMNNCAVSDISVLGDFTKLINLEAEGNKITDASVLSACKNLRTINLSGNELSSLFEIDVDSYFTTLYIDNNKFENLDFLEKALRITTVNASGNKLVDISGLENATQLKTVDFSGNKIEDISVLGKSSGTLTDVNISNNAVKTLKPLAECVNLKQLYADNNKLTDISEVSKFTLLEKFSAAGNSLTSIKALENCKKLKEVNVADNEITSMEPLVSVETSSGLKINVSNNKITALALPKAERFILLDFHGNDIETSLEEESFSGDEIVFDYSDKINFENLKSRVNFYNYYIIDCPLDKRENIKNVSGIYAPHFVTEQEYLESKNK